MKSNESDKNGRQDIGRLRLSRPQDFGKLYDYLAPNIYRHVLIRTNSREEAQDLTAKVFLKAWEYIRGRKRIKNVRAFLYKTADNLVIDWYRTRTATVSLTDAGIDDENPGREPADPQDTGELVTDKFDAELIRQTMTLLGPNDQALLTMRFIDDLTIEEIADALGKSKGAVAVSIHRALRNLARLAKEQYGNLS